MLARVAVFAGLASLALAQEPTCSLNQVLQNGVCKCAPGYFSSSVEESRRRCTDECEEVYKSWFTTSECVDDILEHEPTPQQCDLRCGVRLPWYSKVGVLTVVAAALCTLFFTLPLCVATCCSCIQAKKANKNAKRVYNETTAVGAGAAKDAQLATYNPYAYWPYYGRT